MARMSCKATLIVLVVLTISIVQGGRLVKRPNGWFITGRGCGGSKKIEFLGGIPENPASMECIFIPKDPTTVFLLKLQGSCIYYDRTPNNYSKGKAVCQTLFGRVYEPRDEIHARKVYAYAASFGHLHGIQK